jgi:hypothetical protein
MSHFSSPVASQNDSSAQNPQNTELDLLYSILENEDHYPWQPHAPESAAYFDALAQTWDADGLSPAETERHWQTLSSQAVQLWGAETHLMARLSEQFGHRVPQGILTQLAQQVQHAAQQGGSLIDQMMMAVDSILTQWDVDDLRVMARPLAVAMRDGHGDVLAATLRATGTGEWDTLSDVEQARLGLAIARYAFDHLSD